MVKSYYYDKTVNDWLELVQGERGEQGPQGPPGNVNIEAGETPFTIDNSVGTRVFVGDTMIYGDTGWRDVSSSIKSPWTGEFHVRRIGNVVYLRGLGLLPNDSTSNQLLDLTTGFAASSSVASNRFPLIVQPLGQAPLYGRVLNTLVQVDYKTSATRARDLSGEFPTADPWPTSLPGSPA